MTEYNKTELTAAQFASFSSLRTKLIANSQEIKAILDQGRQIAKDDGQLFLFKGMYIELRPCYDNFNSTWDRISELFYSWNLPDVFPSKEDKQLQQIVKRYYYECCAIYQQHMNPTPESSHRSAPEDPNSAFRSGSLNESRTVRARLPQINLPLFTGHQSEWPLFRDTFRSLIHDELSLSDIEKFLFLTSCLKGPALTLIKGIELTEDNYPQAWKLLNDTYNDKRRLANNYLRTVLEFSPFKTRPTANSLKYLLTTVGESIDSFKQLKIPDEADFILFSLVLRCLDADTRKAFEKQHSKIEFPSCKNLMEFIRLEWRSLDLTTEDSDHRNPFKTGLKDSGSKSFPQNNRMKSSFLVEQPQFNKNQGFQKGNCHSNSNYSNLCHICKENHPLYQCSAFRNLTPIQKLKSLENWHGCKNCLSVKHTQEQCTSQRTCRTCGQSHHSWLHINQTKEERPQELANTSQDRQGTALGGLCSKGEVLLGTVLMEIPDCEGNYRRIRAVTDSGSQYSFMTEDCAKLLGLKIESPAPKISGVGQSPLQGMLGELQCRIRPIKRVRAHSELSSKVIVVKNITNNLPHTVISFDIREQYKSYVLADEEFWKPGSIDFLLGGDLYYDVITGRPITVNPSIPRLIPSIFGFIVAGPNKSSSLPHSPTTLLVQSQDELKDLICRFWEVEGVPKGPLLSVEDKKCESHFVTTHYRLPSGRYVVSLPKKESISILINPRKQAISRLLNLESKLAKDEVLRTEYHNFMSDYLKLGHMRLVQPKSGVYTIPHHPVVKYKDGQIKLRVVFDASCNAGQGSLNDHLLAGPKLQPDITEIISNFRINPFVFITDIIKMFRQVMIHQPDRKYQHILWRFDPSEQIEEYELCTVTQGEKPSPFLAERSIHQLVEDEGKSFPLASRALLEDLYVDDISKGARTLDEVIRLQDELIELLQKGGFQLSKWSSNCQELLNRVEDHQVENKAVDLTTDKDVKVKLLGIQWCPKEDVYSYDIHSPSSESTKRAILSAIARIYDPLGFLSPVVFLAKTILQELWISKCEWDESGPLETCEKWHTFINQLSQLSKIRIPRCITSCKDKIYTIVGFCDASQKGYSAVIYLHVSTYDHPRTHLLRAKTKLAPIKPLTIPRLELCGAQLLARLFSSTRNFMKKLNIERATFFTDAKVVLAWLSQPPQQLNAFVSHRVVEILELTNGFEWNFVPSQENPADCSSRGITPLELPHHALWWAGPQWLSLEESNWPKFHCTPEDIPELKRTNDNVALVASDQMFSILDWIERFSSYMKLLRSVAYMQRFISKIRKMNTVKGPISIQEIRAADKLCIKLIQASYRSYQTSQGHREFKDLHSLSPFIDRDGLLRVGGRLHHSPLPYDAKHPYIIPGNSHYANLLINHYHYTYLHLGSTALQAILLNKYWIISGRKLIRKCIFKCITCYKATRQPQVPKMGNLPVCRFKEGHVFDQVGVDFAGPFYIRESTRRKAALGKAYICLFICMSIKAVHIELVSKCSTDAFMAAFSRFIARRGKPSHVFSDCGTNFIGASNRLKDLLKMMKQKESQNKITEQAAGLEIKWSFNPPSAPHFGGLWEANIKSCKSILYKVIGSTPLTFEEFSTLLNKVEAILNSRPLTPVTSDSTCQEYLTPGHFLIGRPLIAPPEEEILSNPSNLQRWKMIQEMSQHFWNRWRHDYLHHLQQRSKWTKNSAPIKVGDLVIIKESSSHQRHWPMARVIEVHPGKDGVVRVATIQNSSGTYKRPVAKLVSLAPIVQE